MSHFDEAREYQERHAAAQAPAFAEVAVPAQIPAPTTHAPNGGGIANLSVNISASSLTSDSDISSDGGFDPSTRVSPRSRLGAGFGAGHEPHPFDQVLAGGAEPTRPEHRRRTHRKVISFSDEPGSLEGANSLAAMLGQESGDSRASSGRSRSGKNLKEDMLTAGGHGGRRSNSLSGIDLIDLLEGGDARECLSDDVVGTPSGRDSAEWCHATVHVDQTKQMFRLYQNEGNKFLLSARRVGDDFFISQYYDFPEEYDKPEGDYADRFCGVVRQTKNVYRVWNRGCEICDNELAKYRCGLNDSASQRQQLAVVRHHEALVMDGERPIADARQIFVDIPSLDSESLRQGWCERFPREPATSLALASLLPDWNPRIQSLSMKFLHGKVKAASSKNFLVSTATGMDEEHSCLQFGKVKSGLFNLSYRSPVAAIQAFGVALSLSNWLGASALKKKGKKKKKK